VDYFDRLHYRELHVVSVPRRLYHRGRILDVWLHAHGGLRCGLLWDSFFNHVSIIGIVDLVEWLCWGLLLNAYPNRLHDRDWLLDEWIHTHGDVCDWLHWLGEFYHVFVGFLDKFDRLYNCQLFFVSDSNGLYHCSRRVDIRLYSHGDLCFGLLWHCLFDQL